MSSPGQGSLAVYATQTVEAGSESLLKQPGVLPPDINTDAESVVHPPDSETAQAVAPAVAPESVTVVRPWSASDTENSAAIDRELVALARQGDSEAFGQLLARNHRACLRRATSMLRNQTDAEDEVQNAFWKAFERLDQFRGEGTFAAWLTRIVENECLMRLRQERQSSFVYLDDTVTSKVKFELLGQAPIPEEEFGDSELRDLLRTEISRTPPLFRAVVMLRDVQQLPMAEVAARLGLSIPAAKSRLMRARTELRKRLQKHCGRNGHGTLTNKPSRRQAVQIRRA